MQNNSGNHRPWWREPWPWILMAGPFAAIVGCVITIVLAVQNFANEPIVDGVKRGLVVSKPSVQSGRDAEPGNLRLESSRSQR